MSRARAILTVALWVGSPFALATLFTFITIESGGESLLEWATVILYSTSVGQVSFAMFGFSLRRSRIEGWDEKPNEYLVAAFGFVLLLANLAVALVLYLQVGWWGLVFGLLDCLLLVVLGLVWFAPTRWFSLSKGWTRTPAFVAARGTLPLIQRRRSELEQDRGLLLADYLELYPPTLRDRLFKKSVLPSQR
jgi:hypothetical protein